ncbi:MAG: GntR family transcriptional regulator [Planctomycetaceae bacterium]|nr:GntR family transcriptional regulator [Planctomycetaceae bacterium]
MLISIDPSNGTPIYEQIVRQVKYNVANGSLVGGQQVPSVRDLAKMLAINPNTIQRAYQLLQSDGVLETVRGRGQHVAAGAKRSCVSQRARVIHDELAMVVEEGLQAGLEPAELRESFEAAIRRFNRRKPPGDSSA